jgi:uncharacterized protein (DUF1697 family)
MARVSSTANPGGAVIRPDQMPTYLALLRGVNVGKAKRVPMAALRDLLCELGYTHVSTLLNSGNAVFRAAKNSPARLAATISAAISSKLKVEVPVIVKSAEDLASVVAENPLAPAPADHSRLLVAFTQDPKGLSSLAVIAELVTPSERFFVGRHCAYLHCADGILQSDAGSALLGRAGRAATTRNWATVLKLHKLANRAES